VATWTAGILVGLPAGLLDIGTFADLSNIGTLFAFVLVSLGVLILRHKDPTRWRSFRCPGGPIFPVLSVLCCVVLMMGLPVLTWIRFFIWLGIGLIIYFSYSRHRSEFTTAPNNSGARQQ
jgi:APA family basic amino acid/polyamine antiporter